MAELAKKHKTRGARRPVSTVIPSMPRRQRTFAPPLGQAGDDADPPFKVSPLRTGFKLNDKGPENFRPMFKVDVATGAVIMNRMGEVLGYDYSTRKN